MFNILGEVPLHDDKDAEEGGRGEGGGGGKEMGKLLSMAFNSQLARDNCFLLQRHVHSQCLLSNHVSLWPL